MGFADRETVQRVELFMKDFQLSPEDRNVVGPARKAAEEAQAGRGATMGSSAGRPSS